MQTPIQTTLPQAVQQLAAQQGAVAGQARALALPPALSQALADGAQLAGQVSAKPLPGQLTVTTSAGAVQLQTALPLPQNASVTLQLLSAGPPATLQIQTQAQAGQNSGAGAAGSGSTGAAAAGATGGSSGPAVVTTLTQGTVVQATLIAQPAQAAAANAANAAQVQTGAGTAAANASASSQTATSPQAGAAGATPQSTTLPLNSNLPIRILDFALPGQGGLKAGAGSAGSITGTVVNSGGGGLTSLQTPLGTLSLATSQPLPEGTQVLFELAGAARAPANAGASFNLQRWEGLKEAMTLLQQGNPGAAQQVLQSVVPQPGAQMGSAMLFFMSALRGGGMERLLGSDHTKAIERAGGRPALGRADSELSAGVGKARDSGGGEWRAYSLPMQQGGEIDTIRLYVRGERDEAAEEEENANSRAPAKRFIIEANFSRLGPFQFDGLARDKQIDLMVRTHQPLPDGMRDDIRDIFTNATSALGLMGRADFHVVKRFDVVFEEVNAAGGVLV